MKFLVQLDRRGSLDCVFYDLDNIEFEEYIETFGFKTAIGSFSDISFLCPTWQIPGVNLSEGYYNEHSLHEYLNVNEMYATIEKVCNIIDDSDQADDFKWHTNSKYAIASWDTFNQPVADNEDICWGCMNFFNEAIMIKDGDCGYCGECYADLFKTCELCGDTFKKGLGENKYCKLCVDNY